MNQINLIRYEGKSLGERCLRYLTEIDQPRCISCMHIYKEECRKLQNLTPWRMAPNRIKHFFKFWR